MGIRLPRIFGDGMVLQRDRPVRVWGWADAGAAVRLALRGQSLQARTDGRGEWAATLGPMGAGGPFRMEISSEDALIALSDIWVGEVWLCGGQSNMELPMERLAARYGELMRSAHCDRIRQFLVPRRTHFAGELRDYDAGAWEPVAPHTIGRFYGVSYFFAARLYAQYGVPIGLINCAAGGSTAEAWMSEGALRAFPEAHARAMHWRDEARVNVTRRRDEAAAAHWLRTLDGLDEGLRADWRRGIGEGRPIDPTADWALDAELCQNGAFWFETQVELPARLAGLPALLVLGSVRDADFAWINGEPVGETAYQYPPRRYPVGAGLLRAGVNTLVVRALSQRGVGGFVLGKPYRLEIEGARIALGPWRLRVGALMHSPMPKGVYWEAEPGGLHSGMLSPAIGYAMRGAIFYQGESNTEHPEGYAALLRALVADWRACWDQVFPFLYVQLANYVTPHVPSHKSGWPALREQQRACLDMPASAMAVAIDVGEWNDLHPLNKRAVGERLALAARRVAYGEHVEYSGPLPVEARRQGDEIRIRFDCAGGALSHSEGELRVELLDGDARAEWADARIDGDSLLAMDPSRRAAHVRYAWQDSPQGALLMGQSGLPASPFSLPIR